MTDGPDIETLDSREVYRNPWTVVREDRIRRRDGSEGLYGVVEKPDFVVVAALADGHLHLTMATADRPGRFSCQSRRADTASAKAAARDTAPHQGFAHDPRAILGPLVPVGRQPEHRPCGA